MWDVWLISLCCLFSCRLMMGTILVGSVNVHEFLSNSGCQQRPNIISRENISRSVQHNRAIKKSLPKAVASHSLYGGTFMGAMRVSHLSHDFSGLRACSKR